MRRLWSFGTIGTFFSIIVVYFIYKYAQEQGWTVLVWLAWAYLLIWVVLFGIIVLGLVLTLLFLFIGIIWTRLKYRWMKKKHKAKTHAIDAEYEVKKE